MSFISIQEKNNTNSITTTITTINRREKKRIITVSPPPPLSIEGKIRVTVSPPLHRHVIMGSVN